MPARLRLSWGMKTLKLFLLPVLDSLEFGWRVIRYALINIAVVCVSTRRTPLPLGRTLRRVEIAALDTRKRVHAGNY